MPTPPDQPPSSSSVLDRVHALRQQLTGLTATLHDQHELRITTGCEQLDQLLPGGALRAGMLVEWLAENRGSGAGALAMHVAKQAVGQQQGSLVVIDRWRRFYPPAAIAQGIHSQDLIVVRSDVAKIMSVQEELWALDQALRCPAVSAVMAWIDKIDPRAFRRLQLAAETGKTLALLIRPAQVRAQPTWSDVQLLVTPRAFKSPLSSGEARQRGKPTADIENPEPPSPQPSPASLQTSERNENRFCRVTLVRQRGRAGTNRLEGTSVELEIDQQQGLLKGVRQRHASRTLHLAPRVVYPANQRRSAGA